MGDVKTDEMNKNERKFTKVISLLLRFVCFVWQQHCQNTRRRRLGTHKGNTNSQLVRMPLHAEKMRQSKTNICANEITHATSDMRHEFEYLRGISLMGISSYRKFLSFSSSSRIWFSFHFDRVHDGGKA